MRSCHCGGSSGLTSSSCPLQGQCPRPRLQSLLVGVEGQHLAAEVGSGGVRQVRRYLC